MRRNIPFWELANPVLGHLMMAATTLSFLGTGGEYCTACLHVMFEPKPLQIWKTISVDFHSDLSWGLLDVWLRPSLSWAGSGRFYCALAGPREGGREARPTQSILQSYRCRHEGDNPVCPLPGQVRAQTREKLEDQVSFFREKKRLRTAQWGVVLCARWWCESETAITCWNGDGRSWPPLALLTQHGSQPAGQLMASYSSDEDPALRGDFTMDTDFDFELPVRCQGGPSALPRNVYNLTGLTPGESKKQRGKGESGRGGVGAAASKPPAKEKVQQRPPLDIHSAALVGDPVGPGSSPSTGGDGKILCRICGDSAVRHVHYGGHCCFSCKAFFR